MKSSRSGAAPVWLPYMRKKWWIMRESSTKRSDMALKASVSKGNVIVFDCVCFSLHCSGLAILTCLFFLRRLGSFAGGGSSMRIFCVHSVIPRCCSLMSHRWVICMLALWGLSTWSMTVCESCNVLRFFDMEPQWLQFVNKCYSNIFFSINSVFFLSVSWGPHCWPPSLSSAEPCRGAPWRWNNREEAKRLSKASLICASQSLIPWNDVLLLQWILFDQGWEKN